MLLYGVLVKGREKWRKGTFIELKGDLFKKPMGGKAFNMVKLFAGITFLGGFGGGKESLFE